MSDSLYRAEHYRDLAEECRRLAAATLSCQLRDRYSLMAKDYMLLADADEQEALAPPLLQVARARLETMPAMPLL